MFKNIKKIVTLITTIMFMISGIYIYTKIIEGDLIKVQIVAKDNFGYTENEQLTLDAKKTDQGLYEIELPENINTKEVNKVTNVVLENKSNKNEDSINVEVIDNKIQLTQKQLNNYKINLDVEYNAVIKQKQEDGTFETIRLVEKTYEEIKELEITDKTEILYEKILKDEEQEDATISLKGNVPEDAKLNVEKVSEEKIKEIFGDVKIDVAYDIKVLKNDSTEINPKDFEEIYNVSIENEKITENSIIYHVKDDNTYEYANMTKIVEGNVNIDAESFSIYAISNTENDDEIIDDKDGIDTGGTVPSALGIEYTTSEGKTGSYPAKPNTSRENIEIEVPKGGYVLITRTTGGTAMCVTQGGQCTNNHTYDDKPVKLTQGFYYLMSYIYVSSEGGGYHSNNENGGFNLTVKEITPPQITVSPTSANWRNNALFVKITVTQGSYSLSSPSYQYYLSTSSSSLSGGSWTTYTNGDEISINPGNNGKYYLFVKREKNIKENYSTSNGTNTTVSSTTYHRYGTYNFDYTAPTAGTMTMKLRRF